MGRITVQGFLNRFAERHRNRADRPFCFVLGAGASKQSKIPTGEELVRDWLKALHVDQNFDNVPLERWATAERLEIPGFELARIADFYPDIYNLKFPEPQDGFAFLEQLMEGKEPSYGYSVLAYLLSETNHKVVVTTNFDNLVADALSIHAETFPRVVGNDELVRYVLPELRRPLVAKIHGDLGFAPKNRRDEVGKLSDGWGQALTRILGRFTPIFIGYSGSDGSLMSLLETLPEGTPDTAFWCYRKESPPTDRIRKFVDGRRGFLVEIEGFDEVMMQLLDALRRPDVPDLAKALEDRSARRVEAYKKQKDELGAKLATVKREDGAAATAAPISVTPPAPAETRELLEAAGRVLGGKSGEKLWWQWQAEIDQSIGPDATDAKFREALEVMPNSAPLLGNYANFLWKIRKEADKAEEYYRRALEADPNDADYLGNYALFLTEVKKEADKAEEYYRRALEADPTHAIHLGNYALFLTEVKKEVDKAEEYYRRALEADPKHANNLGNYAGFLTEVKKEFDKAAEYYRRALEADPTPASHLGNYARLLFLLGRREEAVAMLRRAEEAVPSSQTDLRLELAYYAVAHVPARWPGELGAVKKLLRDGARSPGWPLAANVARAEKDGHPEPELVLALAAVISDGAPLESLDAFATWKAVE